MRSPAGADPGFALDVIGFGGASVPLSAILPIGVPSCDLLATPDLIGIQLTTGAAQMAVSIPEQVALVGVTLLCQVLSLAYDAAVDLTELTGTNALTLTIGALR
ncbi:MAG: hypothetical protein R3F29_07975 [Planctomycetota bacterium]